MLGVAIAKPGGGFRQLAIPAVRDRVLQTAFAQALSPILEPEFETCSYAYRPGRSIRMAAGALVEWQRHGCPWILDGDIDHFFDNVGHARLLEILAPLLAEPNALALLETWLHGELLQGGERCRLWRGLPQGSPLSPLLSNLYLDPFDESLQAQGHHLIRYADDFVVLCRSMDEAKQALRWSRQALSRLELNLNEDKTRITDFRTGLDFLGVNFRQRPEGGPLQVSSHWPALLPNDVELSRSLDGAQRTHGLLPPNPHCQEPAMTENLNKTFTLEIGDPPTEKPFFPMDEEDGNPVDSADEEKDASALAPLLHTLYVTGPGSPYKCRFLKKG